MLKAAIEYIKNLGYLEEPVVNTEVGIFAKEKLERLQKPTALAFEISTLTGVIDYINVFRNELKRDDELIVQVVSPTKVKVFGKLNEDQERDYFIIANAILPSISFGRMIENELFNIMMQSNFVDTYDKKLILKYIGNIKDTSVKNIGDDGVAQSVTVKTGIATVGDAIVPNPVELAPYRTFQEVEQPVSKFVFRLKGEDDSVYAGLFESDGGAWQNKAILNIKKYLQDNLKDIQGVNIIA